MNASPQTKIETKKPKAHWWSKWIEKAKAMKKPAENKASVPQEEAKIPQKKVESKMNWKDWFRLSKEKKSEDQKSNTFTDLFGKKADNEDVSKSIMDTIVAKTEQEKQKKEVKKEAPKNSEEKWLVASSLFLQFTVVFILVTSAFFYVTNIDQENQVLGVFGIEHNNASRLAEADQSLAEKGQEKVRLQQQINTFKQGFNDQNKEVVAQIVADRLNWNDLIRKINEVTESVYEKNTLLQYVQYNSYSYSVDKSSLVLSGKLSDPKGRNLTKLAELEQAFRYYPSDKDDPEDPRKPYFYEVQEFRALSKNLNSDTGRYESTFSMSLSTKKPEEPEIVPSL